MHLWITSAQITAFCDAVRMTAPNRRALWGDAPFLIGIVLVALSVAGVWLLVSSSRHTDPVLQATRTLTAGEALTSADLRVVDVSLGEALDGYLTPQSLEPGLVVARTLEAGELVPRTAVADASAQRTTTIVVESSVGIPSGVGSGDVVEIWHAPPLTEGQGFDAPRILVSTATVASLVEADGMLAQSRPAVELVIDRAEVADVLSAVTGGSALSIVPTGGAG